MGIVGYALKVGTDTVVGWIIYKYSYRIRITVYGLFDRIYLHTESHTYHGMNLRLYIDRDCTTEYEGIDYALMHISWQNNLVACLADRKYHSLY